eukprot:s136_g13.t6
MKEATGVVAAFAFMVACNVMATKKVFGGKDNKEVSDENPTYLTSDGKTFAVWGIIYLLETMLVFAQWSNTESTEAVTRNALATCPLIGLNVRERLILAFIANGVWLPIFLNEYFWTSLGIMVAYFAFLVSIYTDVNMASTEEGVFQHICLASGIAMNASWIVVALSVNTFVALGFTHAWGARAQKGTCRRCWKFGSSTPIMGCALASAVPSDPEPDVDLSVKEKIVSSWNVKRLPKAQRREVLDKTSLQPDRDSHTFYCAELGSFLRLCLRVQGKLGWKDQHGVAGSTDLAAIMIVVVAAVACWRSVAICDLAWAFVAAWALKGISRMQSQPDADKSVTDGLKTKRQSWLRAFPPGRHGQVPRTGVRTMFMGRGREHADRSGPGRLRAQQVGVEARASASRGLAE